MHHCTFKVPKVLASIIALIALSRPLAAAPFEFAGRVSSGDKIYVETAPLAQFIGDIKKFYGFLRGPQGANELLLLGSAMQAKLGINLIDPAHLNSAGVDTKKPLALSIDIIGFAVNQPRTPHSKYIPDTKAPSQHWTFFIPARDAGTLYQAMKSLFEKAKPLTTPAKEPSGQTVPPVREIDRGGIFQVQNDNVFVAKGPGFIALANTVERARAAIVKQKKPLSSEKGLAAFRQLLVKAYAGKSPSILYYTSTQVLDIDYLKSLVPNPAGEVPLNPLVTESREQLLTESGIWFINDKGIRIHNHAIYAPGFLSNREKLTAKVIDNPRRPGAADYYGEEPAAYAYINFNIEGMLCLLEKMQPETMNNLNASNQKFRELTGKDIRKDFFDNLSGNASILLKRFPDFNSMQEIKNWEFSIHLGYLPEKRADIVGLFEAVKLQEQKKDSFTTYKKEKIGGEEVWRITTTQQVKKPVSPQSGGQYREDMAPDQGQPRWTMETVTNDTYLHLGANEAIIAFNRPYLETMLENKFKKHKDQIASRLMGLKREHLENTNLGLYVKIDSVIDFIKTSHFMFFLAQAMPYLQNLKDFSFTTRREGDVVYSTFNLRLKEDAGFN